MSYNFRVYVKKGSTKQGLFSFLTTKIELVRTSQTNCFYTLYLPFALIKLINKGFMPCNFPKGVI